MSSSSNRISVEELYGFHKMDRELYMWLVLGLGRDPREALHVMAVWMWLEQIGHRNLISKLMSLSYNLMNTLTNEAVNCLECLEAEDQEPPNIPLEGGIPLTATLTQAPLSLHFFKQKRFTVLAGIKSILDNLCSRIFSDMLTSSTRMFGNGRVGFSNSVFGGVRARREEWDLRDERLWKWRPSDDVMDDDKIMFLTFSRGFPVSQQEVEFLFRTAFGENCVVALYMGTHIHNNNKDMMIMMMMMIQHQQHHHHQYHQEEQILFATLVVDSVATVDRILNGKRIAKFRVNGKHIWARKYERRD